VGSSFNHIHHDRPQLTIPFRRRLMMEFSNLFMLIVEVANPIYLTPPAQRVPGPAIVIEFASTEGGPNENGSENLMSKRLKIGPKICESEYPTRNLELAFTPTPNETSI
jgi:hypothetical protein